MKNDVSIGFTNPDNKVTAVISSKSCPYKIKVNRTFTDGQVIYKFNIFYSRTNISVGKGNFKLNRNNTNSGDTMMKLCSNLIQTFMNSKSLHKNIKYINKETAISKELLSKYHATHAQLTNLGYRSNSKR